MLIRTIAIAFCAALSIPAAELSGSVESSGLPIPGASISARQGEVTRTVTTDEIGRYRFRDLAPGEWFLAVEMFGFDPQEASVEVEGEKASQDWKLDLAVNAAPGRAPGRGLAGQGAGAAGQGAPGRRLQVNAAEQIDEILRAMEQQQPIAGAELYRDANESLLVSGSLSRGLDAPQTGPFGAFAMRSPATAGPAGNPFGVPTPDAALSEGPPEFGPGGGPGGRGGPGGGPGIGPGGGLGPGRGGIVGRGSGTWGGGGRGGGPGGRGGGPGARDGRGGPGGPGGPLAGLTEEQRRQWMQRRGALAFGNRINAGRRSMRGSLYFTLGNSALDAKPFSLTGAAVDKAAYAQNRFGASVGGQLKIPKLIDDEQTFLFLNYRGSRSRSTFDQTSTAPTALERAGDFSQSSARGPVSIYDLSSGLPFSNQRIPLSMQSPAAVGLARYFAEPNQAGAVRNYRILTSVPRNSDNLSLRVSRSVTPKDRLSLSYSLQMSDSETAQLQGFRDLADGRGQNGSLSWTRNLSPTVISSLRFSFSRNRNGRVPFFSFGDDVAGELGIAGTSRDPINFGPPNLSFTNFGSLSDGSPSLSRNQTAGIGEDFTVVAGEHTWKLGGEYRRLQLNEISEQNARGSFSFSGISTSLLDADGRPVGDTGFDYADFLLGLPQSSSIRFGNPDTYLRARSYNFYLQDDWRLSGSLSLVLGMRYEFLTPFRETYDRMVNLDFAAGFTDAAAVLPGESGPFTGAFRRTLIDPDRNNLAPRLGLAWKPWAKRGTVVRAGYGIYFNGSIYNQAAGRLAQQPPFSTTGSLTAGVDGVITLENGFAALPASGIGILNTFAVLRDYRAGSAQSWNLSIQENLTRALILEAGYLGTKGARLDVQRSPNQVAGGVRRIEDAVAFIVDGSEGSSIYHAAQLRLTRRFRGGVAANAQYVWSKSIDNVSSFGGGQAVVALYDDLDAERGLSSFDQRHALNVSMTVSSPVARRASGSPSRGLVETLFRDWMFSGGLSVNSGTPFTATVLGNQANSGGSGVVGSGRAQASGEPIELAGAFFNPAAFTTPAAGELGNAGRNTIPGLRTLSLNLGVSRSFQLSDRGRALEFRVEANNLTNTVSFARIGTTVNSSSYGLATGAGAMRRITATLRLRF